MSNAPRIDILSVEQLGTDEWLVTWSFRDGGIPVDTIVRLRYLGRDWRGTDWDTVLYPRPADAAWDAVDAAAVAAQEAVDQLERDERGAA